MDASPLFGRVRSLVAVLLISLAASLVVGAACGSDQSAHNADGHEATSQGDESTDLVVVKSREQGKALPEDLSERILSVEHVVHVEKYIRLRMEDFDVVGVEQGAPMRIMTGQPDVHVTEAQVTAGTELSSSHADSHSVLAGELFAEFVGAFTGQTFNLAGTDYVLTVVGEFSTSPTLLSSTVLMPLALAQKIYDKDGEVTHFWVRVDSPESTHAAIRDLQLELGESVDVLPRIHE